MRIVSLLPSATEMLCALGLGDELVGVTHGCDYPPEVARLPRVTRTSIPEDADSATVDRLVRERHAAGLPLYDLDDALLARLAPDLLVTQGLCDVCAIPDAEARRAACELPHVPGVVSLAPTSLAEVFANLLELGERTGRIGAARALVGSWQQRVTAVTSRLPPTGRPRVSLIEWVDPLYAAGHWTPELVRLAGGEEGHGRPGARSRAMAWSEVVAWQPEVIVLACCGYDERRAAEDLPILERQPGFADLPAVRNGRVFAVDGAAYFSRPGPRLVESLELLAHLLHPGSFPDAPAAAVRLARPIASAIA